MGEHRTGQCTSRFHPPFLLQGSVWVRSPHLECLDSRDMSRSKQEATAARLHRCQGPVGPLWSPSLPFPGVPAPGEGRESWPHHLCCLVGFQEAEPPLKPSL